MTERKIRIDWSAPLFGAGNSATAFRHEAFLYSGHDQFLRGATEFVRSAGEADEAVLVAVVEPRASLLKEALGSGAGEVEFLDVAEVGRNPARIIPAWQDWVDRHAGSGRGFRGIGEPIWAARSGPEIVECEQHDQLLNTAFDGGPGWWLLCPYDITDLPRPVIDRAYDTHPSVIVGDVRTGSVSYPHPGLSVPAMFGAPLAEPAQPTCELGFDVVSLGQLRDFVAAFAEPVLGRSGVEPIVLVVSELATNSILHGGGAGTLRLWREGTAVVCETRDRGQITDPLVGRRRPTQSMRGKAGLWIANQLADLLQIRSSPKLGTVVRARFAGAG